MVDQERHEIRILNLVSGEALEQKLRLPDTLVVELQVGGEPAPEPRIVFRPSGGLTGRTVSLILADQERRHTITVTGTTGAVAVTD